MLLPHANIPFLSRPGGLKGFISGIKKDHGVKHIFFWHSLLGYWSGLGGDLAKDLSAHKHPSFGESSTLSGAGAPETSSFIGVDAAKKKSRASDAIRAVQRIASSLFASLSALAIGQPQTVGTMAYPRLSSGVLAVEPTLQWWVFVRQGIGIGKGPEALYERMHGFLADAGVDGLKVDSQAAAVTLGQGRGGSAVFARWYIKALEASVKRNFREGCINCMCHPSECLMSYESGAVVRASDDFWPGDAASHTVSVAFLCLLFMRPYTIRRTMSVSLLCSSFVRPLHGLREIERLIV